MQALSGTIFLALTVVVSGSERYKDVCGKAFQEPHTNTGGEKIIRGEEVFNGDWPWLVQIEQIEPKKWGLIGGCGGSLISENYIISALHCYAWLPNPDDESSMRYLPPEAPRPHVLIGSVEKSNGTKYAAVEVHYFNQSVAPSKAIDGGHDLVVVKLDKPVKFFERAAPICLSRAAVEKHSSFVVALGWGGTWKTDQSEEEYPKIAKEEIMPLRSLDFCKKAFPWPISGTEICAGSDHRDTADGDSGGPIQYELNQRWHLAGDTSRGPVTPQAEGWIGHGIYARTAVHCDWIEKVTKGEVVCTKDA